MTETEPAAREPVVLTGPVVDLTRFGHPGDLAHITRIEAACVVVPEALSVAASQIPTDSAAVIAIPDGVRVRSYVGMNALPGDALAPTDGHKHVLVVIGALVLTSPVTTVTYQQIHAVGLVLSPRENHAALATRLSSVKGAVEVYDHVEGQRVVALTADNTLSGTTIANDSGNAADILLIAGQAVVDGLPTSVGFARIIVAGMMIAPAAARHLLEPVMTVAGEIIWYVGDHPRLVTGTETYGAAFLDLLDAPVSLIVTGELSIGEDVTTDLLRAKVASIALSGQIIAPRALVPVVQVLATTNRGRISAAEDAAG
ncbi:MAG: hypothetical protein ACR2F6_17695 [Mycobacteriales bacterium]